MAFQKSGNSGKGDLSMYNNAYYND
jgi:hypothetical protein